MRKLIPILYPYLQDLFNVKLFVITYAITYLFACDWNQKDVLCLHTCSFKQSKGKKREEKNLIGHNRKWQVRPNQKFIDIMLFVNAFTYHKQGSAILLLNIHIMKLITKTHFFHSCPSSGADKSRSPSRLKIDMSQLRACRLYMHGA